MEVQERCQEYVQFVSAHRRNGLDGIYQQLDGPLFANWPGIAMPYLIKGEFYYEEAWAARGNGTADQVSQ